MSIELDMRRRRLLLAGVSAGLGLFAGGAAAGTRKQLQLPAGYADPQTAATFWAQPRVVNIVRKVTGEHRRVCYWRDGSIVESGYKEVCFVLRDVRAGKTYPMNLTLLNLLCGLQGWLYSAYGITEPYEITSGYRTSETNATTEGAAKNSLHTRGMAFDGRQPDLPTDYLGRLIAAFQGGGVGFYFDKRNFIHADVGRVRTWAIK
jgi:uncharacterized protein YcbK (DUF882 family)